MKKTINQRCKELKDFSLEIKRLLPGRSLHVSKSEIDKLCVKYDITLHDWEEELNGLEDDGKDRIFFQIEGLIKECISDTPVRIQDSEFIKKLRKLKDGYST